MSAIEDFGCDGAGCRRVATTLVETDDGARVVLCHRHERAAESGIVALRDGRRLTWDIGAGWWFVPARPAWTHEPPGAGEGGR